MVQAAFAPSCWLFEEFVAAAGNVRRDDERRLEVLGVPRNFLISGCARFGTAVIAPDGPGTYQLGDSGELAVIVPARPIAIDDDDVADLVAFRPSMPEKWWLRAGVAVLLNSGAIDRAEIMHEPLVIHSTPLAWLRASGNGAVILDWGANLSFALGGVETIHADTEALAKAIVRRLRDPSPAMPTISWPRRVA